MLRVNLQGTHPCSTEADRVHRRVVDRALGVGENALRLHGERRGARDPDNRRAHRRQEVHRVELRGEQDQSSLGPLHHEDGDNDSDEAAVQHNRDDIVGRRQVHANIPSALDVGQVKVSVLVRADLRSMSH